MKNIMYAYACSYSMHYDIQGVSVKVKKKINGEISTLHYFV